LQRVSETLEVSGAARALRRRRRATLEEALDFVERFEYGGITVRPMQVMSELKSFLQLVASAPPAAVLEIGTARGGTLFLLSHVAKDDAVLVGVDAPERARTFAGRPRYNRRRRLFEAFARSRQRVVYLPMDSHRQETLARVQGALAGQQLDLLFVDGDHTAEGVAADFRMYAPLVRRGGLVAFHDIVPGPAEAVGGVPEFWQEIRRDGCIEFVEDWTQGSCGIGVIRME
jgi:predicted O-methyltransferase YrrM